MLAFDQHGLGVDMETITSDSTEISWDAEGRVAHVRYTAGATLTGQDGAFLTNALARWIGADDRPFSVFADAKGLRGTDAEYRASASAFFRQHRSRAAIALVNMGSVISVLVEMFRIGTGVRLKAFSDETAARAWLRAQAAEAG
ncbi:MAG TPA: hypothetical protein VM925_20260 [Labilithrix sp.]|nr:hypothetical protein [Labilithrix sp.]